MAGEHKPMTLLLESTDRFVTLNGARCRVWTGRTEDGALVTAYIAALETPADDGDLLKAHLTETPPPRLDRAPPPPDLPLPFPDEPTAG